MKLLVFPLLTLIMIPAIVIPSAATASHKGCTQLWVYTQPVQKGPCVIFHHPTGQDLIKANNANIQYNLGIMAAQKANTIIKCPIGHTKSYCDGWLYAEKYLK